MTVAQEVAQDLLAIEAVSLNPSKPFTWASGLKSPIYCDNRLLMGYPTIRKYVAEQLAQKIKTDFPDVEVIAGTATAGIPHAAWVADIMALPMVYIRSSAKKHGQGNQIEGRIEKGQKMVVIEDLLSTGGSVLEAVEAAVKEHADVVGVAAIFTYELPETALKFANKNMPYFTLTNFTTLTEVALENSLISQPEMALLQSWKKDPKNWLEKEN